MYAIRSYYAQSPSNFTMVVDATNPTKNNFPGNETGTTLIIDAGSYNVTETGPSGYDAIFSGCTGTAFSQDILTCTITNDDKSTPPDGKAFLTVKKVVINDNAGTQSPSNFTMVVDVV